MNNEMGFNLDPSFELPKTGNSYFKVEEGKHKIRLLQGPLMQYEIWNEDTEGKRTKEVFENTKENSKIPNVKLVWNVLIFNHDEQAIQIWTISQKKIMQNFIDLNVEVNLSSIDITVIRKGKGINDTTYTLIPSGPSKFDNEEVIKEVKERGLKERLVREEQEEAPAGFEDEDAEINAEIQAKTPVKKMTKEEVEAEFE